MGFRLWLYFAEKMFGIALECYMSIMSSGVDFLFSCYAGPSDHVGLHLQSCIPLMLIMVCTGLIIIISQ